MLSHQCSRIIVEKSKWEEGGGEKGQGGEVAREENMQFI